MPNPLNESQRTAILRRLLEGSSYSEVATECHVSKSTVSGIWREFGQGNTQGLEHLGQYADTLKETPVQLRQTGITPGDVLLGLQSMQTIARLKVEPSRIQEYAGLCHRLAEDEAAADELVQAALSMQELEDSTGVGFHDLVEKVHKLEERRQHLEGEASKLTMKVEKVGKLQGECKKLQKDVRDLKDQRDSLRKDVSQRERREDKLRQQVTELEARKHEADKELAVARKATEDIAALGFSVDAFPRFAQRASSIAHKHSVAEGDLLTTLLDGLDQLDQGLGLESLVAERNQELANLDQEMDARKAEQDKLQGAVTQLRQERNRLEGWLTILREQASMQIQLAGKEVATKLQEGSVLLHVQIHGLLQKVMEAAGKAAETESQLRSHEWVKGLLALVEGNSNDLEPQDVRALALIVLDSLHRWLSEHPNISPIVTLSLLRSLVRAFQEWRP